MKHVESEVKESIYSPQLYKLSRGAGKQMDITPFQEVQTYGASIIDDYKCSWGGVSGEMVILK